MAGWTELTGKAVPLAINNIDTDQIIPARFMSVSRADGYGDYLFYDMRRDVAGELSDNFPLNMHRDTKILIAGKNFGSGSSREAAVYALADAGIQAVIAPSFGDIFASNAVNNGVLPAQMAADQIDQLMTHLGPESRKATVDLQKSVVELGLHEFAFSIEESWRTKLINGWDDLDLTLQHSAQIDAFRHTRIQITSWAWPKGVD